MRKLARVQITHSYVVYADDPDMVEQAKSALYEDLMNAVKYDELHHMVCVEEALPDDSESAIADFLLEKEPDDEI